MTLGFLGYAALGKLLIYLGQKFVAANIKNQFLSRLFECDLCLGLWIYIGLAFFLRVSIFQDVYEYVPVVSEIVTGSVATFVVHLLTIGWKTKFDVVVI